MGDKRRWTEDPLFQTDQSRADHSGPILERMRAWCTERTTAEALEALEAAGVPAGAVQSPQQALDDPQAAVLGLYTAVDYPGLPKPAQVVDLPLQFSGMTAGITRRPPLTGEHTDEILAELGYDAAAISGLRERAIV
jgi:crotonobetainyl-CoA:carnitine CoA-transferase CaiB-like acyl-CoA transferase